ncbi:MAG TPA: helix-turn-helix domain-containing protein [Roseiflexaceae bacterium]|jgi:excisionase family DNA binding protein
MDDEYYTVEEVAKRFKVTKAAVYKWMRAGDLPYVIVGKDRRVTGSALKAFVKPGRSEDAERSEPGVWMPGLAAAASPNY